MENDSDDLKWLFEPAGDKEPDEEVLNQLGMSALKVTHPEWFKEIDKMEPGGMFSNFAILIPTGPAERFEMVEDPLGVPIYADCPAKGEACACTGRCQIIIGHTTDPEKLASYRKDIRKYNEFVGGQFEFYKCP